MRIAHLLRKYNPGEWGGTETALQGLTSGLGSHGVSSLVFAPRLGRPAAGIDPLASAHCSLHRFRAFVPVWGLPAERRQQMVAIGGNLLSFELARSLTREPALDLVHSHALGRIGAIGRAAARWRRLPFVLSIHGGVYDLPPEVREGLRQSGAGGWDWGKAVGALLRTRHLLGESDAVVTCNPREAELIRSHHPRQRVVVQPHGVRTARFASDERAAAQAAFPQIVGREVLLYPGRIDPVKNQVWLVAQLGAVVQRHPRVLLVLAGSCTDPAYGAGLTRQIETAGLTGHVLQTGALPSDDARLTGLFQEAKVVVLPSRSETFGLVILEAWAAGAAVISARTSGAVALVTPGRDGELFHLSEPAGFHQAVDTYLNSPAARASAGAAGRGRARSEFDVEVLAGRMRALYDELITSRHALRHSA